MTTQKEKHENRLLQLDADRQELEAIVGQLKTLRLTWPSDMVTVIEVALADVRDRMEDEKESIKSLPVS